MDNMQKAAEYDRLRACQDAQNMDHRQNAIHHVRGVYDKQKQIYGTQGMNEMNDRQKAIQHARKVQGHEDSDKESILTELKSRHADDIAETEPGVPFYRCTLCTAVVSVWDIQEHKGCPKCKCARIRPSELSFWEMLVQILKHPKLWEWKKYVK